MEFKGTKGKWHLEKHNHPLGGKLLLNDKDYQIGIVDNEYLSDEFEANALLISKAPEMLEMLIDISKGDSPDLKEINKLIKEATEI